MTISKINFLILNFLILIGLIVSGAILNKLLQLVITSICFLISSIYLFDRSPFSKKNSFIIIFLPILLIYGGGYIYDLIYDEKFLGKPFFWSYLSIAILILFSNLYKIKTKKLLFIFFIFFTSLVGYTYYNSTENNKNIIELTQALKVTFVNDENQEFYLKSFKGKITLFEFWTTSCPNCPESIAEFHKLANQYKSYKDIDFRLVNINLGVNQNEEIFKKIDSLITLNKLYTNESIFKHLNFNTVPTILIINRKGEIIYFGYPNFNKLTKNNLYSFIKSEL